MAHYAELNENNTIVNIVFIPNDEIKDENGNEIVERGIEHLKQHHGAERKWIQTSINGKIRNKAAVIGDTYREDLDMFVSPSPYPSWILNETTGLWESPTPKPELTEDEKNSFFFANWDEESKTWIVEQYLPIDM